MLTVVFAATMRVRIAFEVFTAKVWLATSGECLFTLECHGDSFGSAVFLADDQWVLIASDDETAKV